MSPDTASRDPSGEKAARIGSELSSEGGVGLGRLCTNRPVVASRSCTLANRSTVARKRPSGDQATPLSGWERVASVPIICPSDILHTLRWSGELTDQPTNKLQSGLKAAMLASDISSMRRTSI